MPWQAVSSLMIAQIQPDCRTLWNSEVERGRIQSGNSNCPGHSDRSIQRAGCEARPSGSVDRRTWIRTCLYHEVRTWIFRVRETELAPPSLTWILYRLFDIPISIRSARMEIYTQTGREQQQDAKVIEYE